MRDGCRHSTLQWRISREKGKHNLLESQEQDRNLLWLPLPICDFSAHFKFPTAVTVSVTSAVEPHHENTTDVINLRKDREAHQAGVVSVACVS